jgi:hypothetical protein
MTPEDPQRDDDSGDASSATDADAQSSATNADAQSSATDADATSSVTDTQAAALHEVELGIEHFHRAHGHLVAFHHATGRGMDHLSSAESTLRDAGFTELADAIRDDFLPRGVVASQEGTRSDGRWSYDVLETYEASFLDDVVAFGERASVEIADGRRHVHERRQERDWQARADRE